MSAHVQRIAIAMTVTTTLLFASCGDDPSAPDQAEDTSFSRLIGGPGQEVAIDVVVTSDGRRIVMGQYSDTLRVTGSANVLVSFGSHDIFLATFLADGRPASLHSLGGDGFEFATSLSRDTNDDVYMAGYYAGPSSIGVFGLPVHGGFDAFVAKVNTISGAATWLMHGGSTGPDVVSDIQPAGDGTVYFCGVAGSEFNISGEDVGSLGGPSGFVVHVTPGGGVGASQVIDGAGEPQSVGLAVVNGGVYLCGTYSGGSIAIDGTVLANDGGVDGFVAKFGDNLAGDGVIHLGGTGDVNVQGIVALGNAPVVTGSFFGTIDFDVSSSGGEVTSVAGHSDAFVACYNSDHTLRWLEVYASPGDETGSRLATTANGRLLVAGLFDNDQLSLGSFTVENSGGADLFLATLDAAGNTRSAFRVGGPGSDTYVSVTAAGNNPIVVGSVDEEVLFPGGQVRTTFGQSDAFIFQR